MRIPKTFLLKKVREKCLDCCADQRGEVDECTAESCPLWLIRFGSRSIGKVPQLKAYLETLPKLDVAKAFSGIKAPRDPNEPPKRRGRPPKVAQ